MEITEIAIYLFLIGLGGATGNAIATALWRAMAGAASLLEAVFWWGILTAGLIALSVAVKNAVMLSFPTTAVVVVVGYTVGFGLRYRMKQHTNTSVRKAL